MRELLLKRLEDIRAKNSIFLAKQYRWNAFTFNDQHISAIQFSDLSDSDLLNIFEQLIRRHLVIE